MIQVYYIIIVCFLSVKKLMVVTFGLPAVWLYFWRKNKMYTFLEELELLNYYIGIEPCLLAERDRA